MAKQQQHARLLVFNDVPVRNNHAVGAHNKSRSTADLTSFCPIFSKLRDLETEKIVEIFIHLVAGDFVAIDVEGVRVDMQCKFFPMRHIFGNQ